MVSEEEFKRNTFEMAYKRNGLEFQMNKTVEECAELIQAIMKAKVNGVAISYAVIEEMTHVDLCLECLKYRLAQLPSSKPDSTVLDQFNRIKNARVIAWHEFEAIEELKRRP